MSGHPGACLCSALRPPIPPSALLSCLVLLGDSERSLFMGQDPNRSSVSLLITSCPWGPLPGAAVQSQPQGNLQGFLLIFFFSQQYFLLHFPAKEDVFLLCPESWLLSGHLLWAFVSWVLLAEEWIGRRRLPGETPQEVVEVTELPLGSLGHSGPCKP